eukprot:9509554-Alexandrium_andersonii.AAC.1
MELMADGHRLTWPSTLLEAIAKLKFIKVTERSIEARHRIVKLECSHAPNRAGARISLAGRIP